MKPVQSVHATGNYGAPLGSKGIGGLPFWRSPNAHGGTTVYSVWELDEYDKKAIAQGGFVLVGILNMEPIPPISLGTVDKSYGPAPEPVPDSAAQDGL